MSRHEFEWKEDGIQYWGVVGWDKPLRTHFGQVWEKETPDHQPEEPVVWMGTELNEFPDADKFLDEFRQEAEKADIKGLSLPEKIAQTLSNDQERVCYGSGQTLTFSPPQDTELDR